MRCVANEGDINLANFVDWDRWLHHFRQRVTWAFNAFCPLGIKTWVGNDPEVSNLDEISRTAQISYTCILERALLLASGCYRLSQPESSHQCQPTYT